MYRKILILMAVVQLAFASENTPLIKTGNAELDQAIMQYESGSNDVQIYWTFIRFCNYKQCNLVRATALYYIALCQYNDRCGIRLRINSLANFINVLEQIHAYKLNLPRIKNSCAVHIGIIMADNQKCQDAFIYLKNIDLQYLNDSEKISYDCVLAKVYYHGSEDLKNYELAFGLCKKLFYQDKNISNRFWASNVLAEMYRDGQFVEQSLDVAKKFYEILYDQNVYEVFKIAASYNLAKIDYESFSINKDMNRIIKLFKEAFNQDIYHLKVLSAYYLGRIYRSSAEFSEEEGVQVNRQEEAKKYFEYVYNNADGNLKEEAEYYLDLIHGIRKA